MSFALFFNDYRQGAAHVILVCFLPVVSPRLGGVVVVQNGFVCRFHMVTVLKTRLHAEAIAADLISDSTDTCAVLRARLHAEIAVDLLPDSMYTYTLDDEVSDRERDIVCDSQ